MSRGGARPLIGALLALLATTHAAGARELWSRGDASVAVSGSLREVLTVRQAAAQPALAEALATDPRCADASRFADCDLFAVPPRDAWQSLTRLRVRVDARAGPRLAATVVYDHEWRMGILDTLGDALAGPRRDTFLGAEDEIHLFGLADDEDRRRWDHRLYRAFVRFEEGPLTATAGRQRIAWGVGRLWNPIDRFNPIGPLAIEPDESPGIDAVDLRWHPGGLRALQLVYAPGTRSREARMAIRGQGVFAGVDAALMAGLFEQAFAVGLEATGNLGDAAWRLEAVWTDPEQDVWPLDEPAPREPAAHAQVVLGVDTTFDLGSGLYFLIEHLYNGAALGFGEGRARGLLPLFERTRDPGRALVAPPGSVGPYVAPASDAVFRGSGVVTNAAHLTGVQVGYDLGIAWRGDLLVLWDWRGRSAALVPTLRYTGWNVGEITLGVQAFPGAPGSQFGDQEALFYTRLELFF